VRGSNSQPQNTLGRTRGPLDQPTFHETNSPNNYLTNIFNERLKQKKIEAPIFWRLSAGDLVAHAHNRSCIEMIVLFIRKHMGQ
jgi:hypothetical protein